MRTVKRFFLLLFLIPIGVVLVALAVANRHEVRLVMDPLSPSDPALAVDMPLFLMLFLALVVGVFVGGVATWIGQGKWRKTARQRGHEAARWHNEADRLAQQVEAASRPQLPSSVE